MARILIVDDERSIRLTLQEFLRDADYEVRTAGDPDQAWELLAAEEFDVVLADIILPRFTGVRLLEAIKETSLHVQVILMTGDPTIETASAAVRAGAFDYLTKPITKDHLLRTVANAVTVKSLGDERRRLMQDNRRYRENLEQLVAERSAALSESEARFRRMAGSIHEGLTIIEDGKAVFLNDQICEILGYPREEFVEFGFSDILSKIVASEERARLERIVEESRQTGIAIEELECWIVRKDGTRRCVHARYSSDRTAESSDSRYVITTDITERRQAEEEQASLREQLSQAQKMEAVGQLASGVAHDFNNALTVIKGNAELALDDLPAHDPLHELMQEIAAAAEQAAAVTRQLLTFSRKQIIEPRVIDLNERIESLRTMLARLIGEDIVLKSVTQEQPLGRVRVDPNQIEQIVLNLAINARDAMPEGGDLRIETADISLDDDYCRKHANATPGKYVMLAVSDTGCGMSAAIRGKIFEPFFTTKGPNRGTGLGLATVYGIVEQSGGRVEVRSRPGEGSTFELYFPRVDEEAETLATSDKRPAASGGAKYCLWSKTKTWCAGSR